MPASLAAGWDIVVQFTMNPWSIPEAHSCLQEHLGNQYIPSEWNEPLDSILEAEGDTEAALAAIHAWCNKWATDSSSNLCEQAMTPDDCSEVEELAMAPMVTVKLRSSWI